MKTYPIAMPREEIDKIIEAAIRDDYAYTLFMLAKTTGRRLSEYYMLRVKDIDFEKGIMVTWVLKRRKPVQKEAILSPEVAGILKRWIASNKLKLENYVFHKVTKRQILNKVKSYAKKAGITHNVCFHNFRHYFITELVRQGWGYDKIAKLTGHTSMQVISNYDHAVASEIKDDALEALKKI